MRDVIGNPVIVNRIERNDDRLRVHVKYGGGNEKVYAGGQRGAAGDIGPIILYVEIRRETESAYRPA
jgi:hypothetical protein